MDFGYQQHDMESSNYIYMSVLVLLVPQLSASENHSPSQTFLSFFDVLKLFFHVHCDTLLLEFLMPWSGYVPNTV